MKRREFFSMAAVGTAAGLMLANSAGAVDSRSNAVETSGAALTPSYAAPEKVEELSPATLVNLEQDAQKVIPAGAYAFIACGAEKQWTLKENMRAFDDYQLWPNYLGGRAAPDLSTTLLGHKLSLPVITTPMGAHGLAHKSAEMGTARGTHLAGTLMTVSTAANTTIEDIAAASDGPKWFQIYLLEENKEGSRRLLHRAKAAGYSAIVFTIDAFAPGASDEAARLGFRFPPNLSMANSGTSTFKRSLSWDDVAFIKDSVDLPLILKGIISPEFVDKALSYGVNGFQVSNHGGRQLDGVPAAIAALPEVAKQVGGRVPIIMDSGIRRGSDVLKALALGADAVALGRPVLYGLALGGEKGVTSVYQRLGKELARAMSIAGVSAVAEIGPSLLKSGAC